MAVFPPALFFNMFVFSGLKFDSPVEVIEARSLEEIERAFSRIEKLSSRGKYVLGYVEYEAWRLFYSLPPLPRPDNSPLLYFEVFDSFEKFVPQESFENIPATLVPLVSEREYFDVFDKIRAALRLGETYEVNYSYPSYLEIPPIGDGALFGHFLSRQNAAYCAYIKNPYLTVLSYSPELFFEIEKTRIRVKPMKGTAARSPDAAEDAKLAKWLAEDEKNRAENLMIVDLMRNDLSRIAAKNSVAVEKMFEVETLSRVHQMTSTISAELRGGTGLFDVFKNIFPCGSVTGAPKLSTMRIIESLERGRRGVYCGAICFASPEKTLCSVPIRILERRGGADGKFVFRSGSAIVWDSTAAGEWRETLDKASFINGDFSLIETFSVEHGVPKYVREHLQRMQKSAETLGFPFDETAARTALSTAACGDGIFRLELLRGGRFSTSTRPLSESKTARVEISETRVDSRNIFLRHKTTKRDWYAAATRKIASGEVYDVIFQNERGEITEGSRSNIIVEKDGKFYTPPAECGLLEGVGRRVLSDKLTEKILYPSDLYSADAIYSLNSVRGLKKVNLFL